MARNRAIVGGSFATKDPTLTTSPQKIPLQKPKRRLDCRVRRRMGRASVSACVIHRSRPTGQPAHCYLYPDKSFRIKNTQKLSYRSRHFRSNVFGG